MAAQLVIQTDGPFRVFCNTCDRWVKGERLNIDGTHDADESKPIDNTPRTPKAISTTHTVWESKARN